jgi:uridine phosphorylase
MSSLLAAASTRFTVAYDALFALLDDYPIDKRTQTGACGRWSPKEILAHMCGWVDEAVLHFDAFDAGTVRDVKYKDIDAVNDQFVESCASFSWDEIVARLREGAVKLPKRAKSKPRYSMWLAQLARDCENHSNHLRDFLVPKPAEVDEKPLYKEVPILEFDENREAIIEPTQVLKPLDTMPERVVLCFFQEVIDAACGDGKAEVIKYIKSEMGKMPIYSLEVTHPDTQEKQPGVKQRIAVMQPGVGAPLAGGALEELIALGGKIFIAAGGAGVLNKDIPVGNVIIPTSAVRDEGTSYHYLPPGREVAPAKEAIAAIEASLKAHNVPYITGKTWTTDGIYRETPAKVARRREEGCVTVEMEASAFFAVAQFRTVKFGQLLYGGDDVSGEKWDSRGWEKRTSTREKLFWLAVESVLRVE